MWAFSLVFAADSVVILKRTCASIFVVSSEGFFHLNQTPVTAVLVGVCVALLCIMSAIVIACRGQSR